MHDAGEMGFHDYGHRPGGPHRSPGGALVGLVAGKEEVMTEMLQRWQHICCFHITEAGHQLVKQCCRCKYEKTLNA